MSRQINSLFVSHIFKSRKMIFFYRFYYFCFNLVSVSLVELFSSIFSEFVEIFDLVALLSILTLNFARQQVSWSEGLVLCRKKNRYIVCGIKQFTYKVRQTSQIGFLPIIIWDKFLSFVKSFLIVQVV